MEAPEQPADPVAAENSLYVAVVSEYVALRRAGAGMLAASAITAAHLYYAQDGRDPRPGE